MCRAVQCSKCHKPTWAGCGAHVEQVLGHIPTSARCSCREQAASATPTPQGMGIAAAIRRILGK